MSAYLRGASWLAGVLRLRTGSWSGSEDGGYVWTGSAWAKFQPGVTVSDFLPPENFQAADIGSTSVQLTWTNPDQDLEPTNIQYRMPELTPTWTELPYPISTVSYSGLNPSAEYQVQIRYVIREDGIVVKTSAVREVFFTTNLIASPTSPAELIGGTTPGDSVVEWPIAGTGGSGPGPVGGSGCWWEYVVQIMDGDGDFTDVDPIVTGELAGDIGDWEINFVDDLGLSCADTYRLKFREVCDSVPGVWNFADPFIPACDWSEACAGRNESPSFGDGVFSDAIYHVPWFCPNPATGQMAILDYVSLEELGRGSGLSAPLNDVDSEWCLLAKPGITFYEPLAAGVLSSISALTDADGWSFSIDTKLINQPTPAMTVMVIGGVVRVLLVGSGTGYRARVTAPRVSGGALLLEGTTEIELGTYGIITVRIDPTGTMDLWVNGEMDAENTDAIALNFAAWDGTFIVNGNDTLIARKAAGWDRVLDDAEIASFGDDSVLAVTLFQYLEPAVQPITVDAADPLVEIWGASGNHTQGSSSGLGGFVAANLPPGDYEARLGEHTQAPVNIHDSYDYAPDITETAFGGGGFSGLLGTTSTRNNFRGGGATDVRPVSGDDDSRLIVAGGGGAQQNGTGSGHSFGGMPAGGDGSNATEGGKGGDATDPGVGGTPTISSAFAGWSGSGAVGGRGGGVSSTSGGRQRGGGGGGGWRGGGGGAGASGSGGEGGGGSSIVRGSATHVDDLTGANPRAPGLLRLAQRLPIQAIERQMINDYAPATYFPCSAPEVNNATIVDILSGYPIHNRMDNTRPHATALDRGRTPMLRDHQPRGGRNTAMVFHFQTSNRDTIGGQFAIAGDALTGLWLPTWDSAESWAMEISLYAAATPGAILGYTTDEFSYVSAPSQFLMNSTQMGGTASAMGNITPSGYSRPTGWSRGLIGWDGSTRQFVTYHSSSSSEARATPIAAETTYNNVRSDPSNTVLAPAGQWTNLASGSYQYAIQDWMTFTRLPSLAEFLDRCTALGF